MLDARAQLNNREGDNMVQTLSIRTKLIVAMLALVATVALMGVTAHDAHAQVTEIRKVFNNTRYDVYLWNREATSGKRLYVHAGQTESFNEWVPWATDSTDFNRGHYIEIGFTAGLYTCGGLGECPQRAIWQEARNNQPYPGDFIRYDSAGYFGHALHYTDQAPPMAGDSATGGRRDLIINLSQFQPLMRAHLVKVS